MTRTPCQNSRNGGEPCPGSTNAQPHTATHSHTQPHTPFVRCDRHGTCPKGRDAELTWIRFAAWWSLAFSSSSEASLRTLPVPRRARRMQYPSRPDATMLMHASSSWLRECNACTAAEWASSAFGRSSSSCRVPAAHTATRTQPHADTQKCVRQRRGTLVLCYHVRTMAEGAPQATRRRVRSVLVANFCTIVAMEVCITCSDRPARGSNGSRMSGTQSTVWTRRVHRHEALVETIRAA